MPHPGSGQFLDGPNFSVVEHLMIEDNPWLEEDGLLFVGADGQVGIVAVAVPAKQLGLVSRKKRR